MLRLGGDGSRVRPPGRFLFVVPPLLGHVAPTVAVARELAGRGHRVAWAGHADPVAAAVPPGATFLPVAGAMPPDVAATAAGHITDGARIGGVSPVRSFQALWDDFVVPIAHQMLPGIHDAVDAFAPDVLVVDQQAVAGAAVAERRGLRWATSATTSAELVDPLAPFPKVHAWLRRRMGELLRQAGLDGAHADRVDPRFSPHLVLAFTSAELVGPTDPGGAPAGFPGHYALVGPAIAERHDSAPFRWDWLDHRRPRVLVSLGSVLWYGGREFYAVAAEAFAGMDAQAVFVAPPEVVPHPPANVLVVPVVPQVALLPHMDAVVCHGGHNTVCESLACGLPLVVAPFYNDQPIVAAQVVRAGAGVRVRFGRVTAAGLRDAVEQVLTDPTHRAAAARLRASFASAGGAPAAADRLARLLPPPRLGRRRRATTR